MGLLLMANANGDAIGLYEGLRGTLAKHLASEDMARMCLDRVMAAYALEKLGAGTDTSFRSGHAEILLPPDVTASLHDSLRDIFNGRDTVQTACALLDSSAGLIHGDRTRDAGVHYTPMPVARYICRQAIGSYLLHRMDRETGNSYAGVEELVNNSGIDDLYHLYFDILKSIKIFDSSCGSGIFLEAALDELYGLRTTVLKHAGNFKSGVFDHERSLAEFQIKADIVENNLYGMDVEPYSIEVAKLRLRLLAACPKMPKLNLISDNALFARYPAAGYIDVIVGNPPYMRVKSMFSDTEKQESIKMKNHMARKIRSSRLYKYQEGNLNLYKLFLERNLSFLKAGGSMGLIIPSSFLNEATSEKLRKHVFDICNMDEIVEIPEISRIFPGVNQATAILVLNKSHAHGVTFKLKLGAGIGDLEHGNSSISIGYQELEALTDGRMEVPLLREPSLEWDMMKRLKAMPSFKGGKGTPPVGEISVGQVDETIDKEYISESPTGDIFIKGIHLKEYKVDLSPGGKQPRWVKKTEFIKARPSALAVIDQWRIVGRNTQNKACARRLKFAMLPPGYVCGNSIKQIIVTDENIEPLYLLGLLNSSVLNWCFELFCSQNNIRNYNIEALPIARAPQNVQALFARIARLIVDSTDNVRLFLDQAVMDSLVFELYFLDDACILHELLPLQKLNDADFIRHVTGDAAIAQKLRDIMADERFGLIRLVASGHS